MVGVLGSVAAPVAPPAYLRDLLTARIERETGEAPSDSATVIPFPEQAGGTELRPAPARSSGSGWFPWAIAAALLIAFAYTFAAWRTERRTLQAATERDKNASPEPEENARLKEELKQREGDIRRSWPKSIPCSAHLSGESYRLRGESPSPVHRQRSTGMYRATDGS